VADLYGDGPACRRSALASGQEGTRAEKSEGHLSLGGAASGSISASLRSSKDSGLVFPIYSVMSSFLLPYRNNDSAPVIFPPESSEVLQEVRRIIEARSQVS
jgi:hypothetical protein